MSPWIILPLGIGILFLLVRLIENILLYPRDRKTWESPHEQGFDPEDVQFYAKDGVALHGWWFEHPGARSTLLVCHGNAGNLSSRIWIPRDLADVPMNIFIFDYRGYGKSRGIPNESGTRNDVIAAYEVIQARCGNLPTIVYGRSLGGAVALQLAAEHQPDGLILESTFTSVLEMGQRFYPWLLPGLFCKNHYRSLDRIRQLQIPILIAHSPDDETVPYDMGTTLSETAPFLWKFCTLSGLHDDAGWQNTREYANAVRQYIAERSRVD